MSQLPIDTDAEAVTPGAPSSRAFSRTTGYFFQSIGFLLSMVMCCWWPCNTWQEPAPMLATSRAAGDVEIVRQTPPQDLWAMFGVAATFGGGLLLIAIGFGLQQDRLRTARTAMIVTGVIALYFWVYLGVAAFSFPATGRLIAAGLMALLWTACFLLAGASNEQLRRHPPTPSEQSWTSHDEDAFRKSLSPDSPDKMNP